MEGGFRESLENRVYRQIKGLLADYRVAPGQRLVYQDLADRFHVSRTPVKNALSRLEQEGYVTLIPEKGYIVKEITMEEASGLLDVLENLELYAAKKAIKDNFALEGLVDIKGILKEYSSSVRRELNRERFKIDARLHTSIVRLARNVFLADKVNEIYEKIYLQIRISNLSQKRGMLAEREHYKIYKAIEEGNLKEAAKWIKKHAVGRKANILKNAFINGSS